MVWKMSAYVQQGHARRPLACGQRGRRRRRMRRCLLVHRLRQPARDRDLPVQPVPGPGGATADRTHLPQLLVAFLLAALALAILAVVFGLVAR